MSNCRYCRDSYKVPVVDDGFCSQLCRAKSEHENMMRAKERMSIHLSELDDGAYSVELKTRDRDEFSEMTKTFDSFPSAVRGIATLCTKVADDMESK